jgi:hypothetical protein
MTFFVSPKRDERLCGMLHRLAVRRCTWIKKSSCVWLVYRPEVTCIRKFECGYSCRLRAHHTRTLTYMSTHDTPSVSLVSAAHGHVTVFTWVSRVIKSAILFGNESALPLHTASESQLQNRTVTIGGFMDFIQSRTETLENRLLNLLRRMLYGFFRIQIAAVKLYDTVYRIHGQQ